jgi:hypothetical protein
MKEIPLTKGLIALVDDIDYERLLRNNWCAFKAGSSFYAMRGIKVNGKCKTILMHRQILNAPKVSAK